jgi:riboflavin synthase
MFTGIVEALGEVRQIAALGSNLQFTIASPISSELKIDQSLAHNGVCLTVVALEEGAHVVTAVEETLRRSNLGKLAAGAAVNLERAMRADSRLDGHLVQGHVDATARCVAVEPHDGSWYFHFRHSPDAAHLLVDKGSVCIDGVSLTVIEPKNEHFSVAIIPYTFEHTTFRLLRPGDEVNVEFDIIGKYIARYAMLHNRR